MLTASQANNNNGGSIKLRESASLKCLSVYLEIIMQSVNEVVCPDVA